MANDGESEQASMREQVAEGVEPKGDVQCRRSAPGRNTADPAPAEPVRVCLLSFMCGCPFMFVD